MSREFKVILLGDKGVGKTLLSRCQLEAIAEKTLDGESPALMSLLHVPLLSSHRV